SESAAGTRFAPWWHDIRVQLELGQNRGDKVTLRNKILAGAFGALGLMAVAASPASAAAVLCTTITTVGGFASAGSCDLGDKTFQYVHTDLADTFNLQFTSFGLNLAFNA